MRSGSILERFFILFDSDASAVKKGAHEAGQATEHLDKQLGHAAKSAHHLGERFKEMVGDAIAAMAVFYSADAVFENLKGGIEYELQMHRTAEAIGVTTSELVQWDQAVVLADGHSGEIAQTIGFLAKNMAQVDATGKGRLLPFFKQMGISLKDVHGKAKPILQLLPEIADYFHKIGAQQALGLGEKLGMSEGVILLLRRGGLEVQELLNSMKELGDVTQQNAENAEKVEVGWKKAKIAWQLAGEVLSGGALGSIESITHALEWMGKWVAEHRTFIVSFLQGMAAGLLACAIASGIFLAPWILIGVTIVAVSALFALFWTDLMAYVRGADSVIGRFWAAFDDAMHGIAKGLLWLSHRFMMGLQIISQAFHYVIDEIVQAWEWLRAKILKAVQDIIDIVNRVKHALGLGGDNKITVEGKLPEETQSGLMLGKTNLAIAGSSPIAAQTTNGLILGSSAARDAGGKTVTLNAGGITINAQTNNPEEHADLILGVLHGQLRQVNSQGDDGVSH